MLVMYDEILRQSAKAIELKFGPRRVWIPLSQITKEDLTWNIIEIPDWLGKAKDLKEHEAGRKMTGTR